MLEDEEYGYIFVTQSSSDNKLVSLEENQEDSAFGSQEYSDISDAEGEVIERRLR